MNPNVLHQVSMQLLGHVDRGYHENRLFNVTEIHTESSRKTIFMPKHCCVSLLIPFQIA